MLRQRVITGLVVTALGLAALFGFPVWAFSLFAGLVLLGMGGREGARLSGLGQWPGQLGFAAVLLSAAGVLYLEWFPGQIHWILIPACLLWLLPMVWLARSETGCSTRGVWMLIKLVAVAIVLLPAWAAVSWLKAVDPWLVFVLLVMIATGDIGAYFFGRAIGGAKLAPKISPGKTWAGVGGAVLVAPLCAALAVWLIPGLVIGPGQAALLALALTPVGIAGDLFMSLLKRHAGLKDTGSILPGHGGVLDRVDSLVAGLTFFALAIWYLQS